jgi:predicted GNAT family acetyltransferase
MTKSSFSRGFTMPTTSVTSTKLDIRHDAGGGRFQTVVDGETCVCDYSLDDGVMNMVHTGVPARLEGRGIASALVQAAFDHARAEGLKVRPLCSYVVTWTRRHPEVARLLA